MLNRRSPLLLCALFIAVASFWTPQRADAGVISFACSPVTSTSSSCPKFTGSGLIEIELTVSITQSVSGLFHTTTTYPGGIGTFSRSQALFNLPGFINAAVTETGSRPIPALSTVFDTSGGGLTLSGTGSTKNSTQFGPYLGVGDFTFNYIPIGDASMTSALPSGDITWQSSSVFVPTSVSSRVTYTVQDSVPEPSSMFLFATGVVGLVARRYRGVRV